MVRLSELGLCSSPSTANAKSKILREVCLAQDELKQRLIRAETFSILVLDDFHNIRRCIIDRVDGTFSKADHYTSTCFKIFDVDNIIDPDPAPVLVDDEPVAESRSVCKSAMRSGD